MPEPQKIPTVYICGVVVLDLPCLSRTVGQNYQTLPSHFVGYDIRPLLVVGYGLSWHPDRQGLSWKSRELNPRIVPYAYHRLFRLGRLPAHFWRYFYEWWKRWELNPLDRLSQSACPHGNTRVTYPSNLIPISQPCIYIISYSVEFVKCF